MQPRIDHIHITVQDLARAERFYDALLPILGFDLKFKERDADPAHDYEIVEYHSAAFSFGIVSARSALAGQAVHRRRPGALHHLAFRANGPAAVDEAYARIARLPGARIRIPPRFYPEYCRDYYAFFFLDGEGIEYEVVSFDREGYFDGREIGPGGA